VDNLKGKEWAGQSKLNRRTLQFRVRDWGKTDLWTTPIYSTEQWSLIWIIIEQRNNRIKETIEQKEQRNAKLGQQWNNRSFVWSCYITTSNRFGTDHWNFIKSTCPYGAHTSVLHNANSLVYWATRPAIPYSIYAFICQSISHAWYKDLSCAKFTKLFTRWSYTMQGCWHLS
jgi:hypothetical protein